MAAAPKWKRLGYSSERQYRNAKARQQINPNTGKPFTSERQRSDYEHEKAGRGRNSRAEYRARNKAARSRGFASANQQRSLREMARKYYGISLSTLQDMRAANRIHWKDVQQLGKKNNGRERSTHFPIGLHRYHEPVPGKEPERWARQRRRFNAHDLVDYIVGYNRAFVDDRTNWESVLDEHGHWIHHEVPAPVGPGGAVVEAYLPLDRPQWRTHFLQFIADIYSTDVYDSRYGIG